MRSTMFRMNGFSLIELMIGMLLGLVVTAAAVGIFASNSNTQRAAESLGRIQENARVAYELMARDIREGAGNICSRNLPVANVLNNAGTVWWSSGPAVTGFDGGQAFPDAGFGTGAGQRVSGTDAIQLVSTSGSGFTVASHNPAPATALFTLNTASHGLVSGDILIACDMGQVSVFQMSTAAVTHTEISGSPGNCTTGLGFSDPIDCASAGQQYQFAPNAQVARLRAVRWYVANNGRGGRSLYQAALRNPGGTPTVTVEEVAEGVTDLQFEYLPVDATAYAAATGITDWTQVVAVRVTVTLSGGQGAITENVGTDGAALQRQFSHVVTLRNRLP